MNRRDRTSAGVGSWLACPRPPALSAGRRYRGGDGWSGLTLLVALERDPSTAAVRADADYLAAGLGRGLYRTEVDFDCVGEWGAEVFVEAPDGSWASERLRFAVHGVGNTPAIGATVPLSDSLTASNLEEVSLSSSDTNP